MFCLVVLCSLSRFYCGNTGSGIRAVFGGGPSGHIPLAAASPSKRSNSVGDEVYWTESFLFFAHRSCYSRIRRYLQSNVIILLLLSWRYWPNVIALRVKWSVRFVEKWQLFVCNQRTRTNITCVVRSKRGN